MSDTREKYILREEIKVAECGAEGHRRMAEQHEEAARALARALERIEAAEARQDTAPFQAPPETRQAPGT